jgi:hypothetical protein
MQGGCLTGPPYLAAFPGRRFPGAMACCLCGRQVREAELVRPFWGPRPCPQGHEHHPLEVVPRCLECSREEERRYRERLARVEAGGAAPGPSGPTAVGARAGGDRAVARVGPPRGCQRVGSEQGAGFQGKLL